MSHPGDSGWLIFLGGVPDMGQILHLTSAIRLAARVKPFSLISRSKFSSSRYDTKK